MGRLTGKIAVITGAASGIGAAEANLFAQEGATVVATDIQIEKLKEVVNAIKSKGQEAIWLKHDVSTEEDWKSVVEKTIDTYGRIDVLVNNAGTVIFQTLQETTFDDWSKTMNVNAGGVFLGMKSVIPYMQNQGGGSIVNTSSVTGISGIGFPAYNASKGAVRSITKQVALDHAKDRIRINSLHPGVIESPFSQPLLDIEEARKGFEEVTLLPYLGKPEDVAYGALYLASDESKFVTGSELVIDGGLLAQ